MEHFKSFYQKVIGASDALRICLIWTFLFLSVSAFAFEDKAKDSPRILVISQLKYETRGALISRPSPLDEKIRDIIISNNIKSLEDYAHWLKANVKYKKDKDKDFWSHPSETLRKRYGDCEDIAFLNKAALRVLGYQPKVLATLRIFANHAICVFKENGCYSLIDNTELKRTRAQSIAELAEYLFAKYNCASIGEVQFKSKGWEILFKRDF